MRFSLLVALLPLGHFSLTLAAPSAARDNESAEKHSGVIVAREPIVWGAAIPWLANALAPLATPLAMKLATAVGAGWITKEVIVNWSTLSAAAKQQWEAKIDGLLKMENPPIDPTAANDPDLQRIRAELKEMPIVTTGGNLPPDNNKPPNKNERQWIKLAAAAGAGSLADNVAEAVWRIPTLGEKEQTTEMERLLKQNPNLRIEGNAAATQLTPDEQKLLNDYRAGKAGGNKQGQQQQSTDAICAQVKARLRKRDLGDL